MPQKEQENFLNWLIEIERLQIRRSKLQQKRKKGMQQGLHRRYCEVLRRQQRKSEWRLAWE